VQGTVLVIDGISTNRIMLKVQLSASYYRVVQAAGVSNARLKWPNDLVVDGRKLAGILIDVKGETGGPLQAVIGVGLNFELPQHAASEIVAAGGLEPASLSACGCRLNRNEVAARLISELHTVMSDFSVHGFSALAEEWRAADYLAGREVNVTVDDSPVAGIVRGIASDGRLQLDTADGIVHLATGDVSVRLRA